MQSTNQKLIAQVKAEAMERRRVLAVRLKHARQEFRRCNAELDLLIDDFVQEGHDLTNPAHRELLYQVVERKYAPPEEEEYGTDLTF